MTDISDDPAAMRRLLETARTIAIVGCSPKPERDSHQIAKYMMERGYDVIPVNPGHAAILGLPCCADLKSVPRKIDLVNVFRAPDALPGIVDEAIAAGAAALWTQLGVVHPDATERASKAGLTVVVDK